jgi:hypothetical protein
MKLFFDRDEDKVFEALFGRSIIAWNSTETDVRNFLLYLASDCGKVEGLGPWILVAEMGTRHISQTIQAYADATIEDETTKALVHHVAALFENLVSYRNHYVHGLIHIVENVGQLGATTAKSKFKVVHGEVPIEEIGAFIDKVGELADFVYETLEYLKTGGSYEMHPTPSLLPTLVKQTTLLPLRQKPDEAAPETGGMA